MTVRFPKGLSAKLWPHQVDAVRFAHQRVRTATPATCLIRMPTGTGKTGVIAVLTMVFPTSGWSLVLSPWDNLCDQLVRDLRKRFWNRIEWEPRDHVKVTRLLPRSAAEALEDKSDRTVLVATFATLVQLFGKSEKQYEALHEKVGLVIADEGHYEPAVRWGRAVKNLESPTILLTATPYRNDLRLFRITRDNTYNFTHEDAENGKILRTIKSFVDLGIQPPSDTQLPAWCDAFVGAWNKTKRKHAPKNPRAIIQCSGSATVRRITSLLRARNLDAVGVHHRFAKEPTDWLVQKAPVPDKVSFEVWVHERKLTEGLDDHRFNVVAFVQPVRNDRALVQQLGRILRPTPEKIERTRETAEVFHSSGLQIERSWRNYRAFEVQPGLVATERYRTMVDSLLKAQPDLEYFGSRFRRRFDPRSSNLADELLLPSSVVVRRVHSKFNWEEFVGCVSDELMLQDRLLLGPEDGPITGPSDSRLWIYAGIFNSALLLEHAHYEIRLGASVAAMHGDLVFLANTESVYAPGYLLENSSKLSADELARSLHGEVTPQQTSLVNSWPTSGSIGRSSISGEDLEITPTRLTDATFLCASARVRSAAEFGDGRARKYVGFGRGRISEQLTVVHREQFTLSEFCRWTKQLAARIADSSAEMPKFFRRYLLPVAPPAGVPAHYLVMTNSEALEIVDSDGASFEVAEPIVPLEAQHGGKYAFEASFRSSLDPDAEPIVVNARVNYDAERRRFVVEGDELNARLMARSEDAARAEGFVTHLNKNDDSFGILMEDGITYYTAQSFYRVDYTFAEERLSDALSVTSELRSASSEKGSRTRTTKKWGADSLFAQLADPAGPFWREFGNVEFLFCDDMQTEIADFVFVDFKRRKIAFAHAKHGARHKVSASALHEVVGQAMKNLGAVARAGTAPKHIDRWNRKSVWDGTKIRRWRCGPKSLPENSDLWGHIRSEVLDHPQRQCEIWLVLGGTLSKEEFVDQIRDEDSRTPEAGQVVRLLSGLLAACAELQVELRVFCD